MVAQYEGPLASLAVAICQPLAASVRCCHHTSVAVVSRPNPRLERNRSGLSQQVELADRQQRTCWRAFRGGHDNGSIWLKGFVATATVADSALPHMKYTVATRASARDPLRIGRSFPLPSHDAIVAPGEHRHSGQQCRGRFAGLSRALVDNRVGCFLCVQELGHADAAARASPLNSTENAHEMYLFSKNAIERATRSRYIRM